MATEYRLTLADDIPLELVAGLVAPEGIEESAPAGLPRLLSADLNKQHGYTVSIYAGSHGYYDAEDDDGSRWEWEPERYVNIGFRMQKNQPSDIGTREMVASVARVLAARPEDAALILNSNWLLLTRFAGRLRKHTPSWWNTYNASDLIPE